MALSGNRERPSGAADFVDFAQEFLRRNDDYRRQFDALSSQREGEVGSLASLRMARSWGLEFPDRSILRRSMLTSDLEHEVRTRRA